MAAPPCQREVAAFLAAITGQGVVETHISLIFLGETEALKLKKAVDLGFLDFRSLAERARLTALEQALNAPHAPGLYLGVVPIIRRPDGSLALGGEGEVLDWVLRMRRLPPDAFLDAHAPLDPAGLDALADAVAALHAAAAPRSGDGAMDAIIAGNRRAALEAGLDPAAVEAWHAAALARHEALRPWLAARAAAGFLRRCHGDLHLGNICLLEGRPTPFDALEFDEALASIDVGYDLAFLLMDLDRRWGRPAANRVLNRWVARSGDAAMVRGLPLWLSLRAMIRAHVAARRGAAEEASGLLALAARYLAPPPPRLLAIGGLQGSGKSTLARALAPWLGPAPGALVLRSDEIRKRRAGVAPEQRLPPDRYSPEESAAVMAELRRMAAEALAAGHAVIADAVFLREAERTAMAALHPSFLGIWLEAPIELLRARIAARQSDASDADAAVLEATAARDPGPILWQRLPADGQAEERLRKMLDLPAVVSP
ncbi:MAG: AAA family ATPase [Rhodovarius sp.]|nr:AAA family ATPase [Rhodovarius sp.]